MKNRTAKRLLSLVLIAALTMTLFVGVVSPTRAAAAEFSDVNGHWAKNSIVRWMDEDVIHGYPDGTFRPNDKITRAEFATVLKNLLLLTEQAENPFSDLPDNWMKKPVLCLVKEGIIKGYSDGTFKPNNKILRQEAFTMICRAFYFPKAKDTDLSVFSDGEDVGNYAKGYIKTLVDLGAIRGYPDGTILPKEPISRAEIMTVLDRLISLYVNEDDTKAEAKKSFVLVVADNAVLTAPTDSYVIARRSWKNLRVNCIPVDDEQLYLVPAERHVPVTDAAVPATCAKDGLTEGSRCSFCGEILTAQQKIPALGHLWDEAAFEWDGLDSATATRVCKRDESHVEKAESVITSKVTTEPTNADAGARLYTAEATFNDGTVATDHKTEILPPKSPSSRPAPRRAKPPILQRSTSIPRPIPAQRPLPTWIRSDTTGVMRPLPGTASKRRLRPESARTTQATRKPCLRSSRMKLPRNRRRREPVHVPIRRPPCSRTARRRPTPGPM